MTVYNRISSIFLAVAVCHAAAADAAGQAQAPKTAVSRAASDAARPFSVALARVLNKPSETTEAEFSAIVEAFEAYAVQPAEEAPRFAAMLLRVLASSNDKGRIAFAYQGNQLAKKVPQSQRAAFAALQVANLAKLDWQGRPKYLKLVPEVDLLATELDLILRKEILGDGPLPEIPTVVHFYTWMNEQLARRLETCGVAVNEEGVIHKDRYLLGFSSTAASVRRRDLAPGYEYWTNRQGELLGAVSGPLSHVNVYYALSGIPRSLTRDGIVGTRVGLEPNNPSHPWIEQEGFQMRCDTMPDPRNWVTSLPVVSAQWQGQRLLPLPDPQVATLEPKADWADYLVCAHRRFIEPLGKYYCTRL